jgi:hypothetical protein
LNKSEQYYKQIKKREKAIVPRSALYRKYFNDNNNKRKSNDNDNDEALPTRSELIAQLRKVNNVKNYEDFIGVDNDDDKDKHNSNFYQYYTNEHNNNNDDDISNIKNNDDSKNTDYDIPKSEKRMLGFNNIFALKITSIFVKYINHRQHVVDHDDHKINENSSIIDNDNSTTNNDIDTIDNVSISDSNNVGPEIVEDISQQMIDDVEVGSYDESANVEVVANDIDVNSTHNVVDSAKSDVDIINNITINDNSNTNQETTLDNQINNNDIDKETPIQPTPPINDESKKKRPTKKLKIVDQKIPESQSIPAAVLDYNGAEYRRRRYWSLRSQKLESSLRLIERNNIVMQDVHRMYEISKASNIAMMDTFIKLDNKSHGNIQHSSCSWKYLTKEYLVAVNNCFEDDINPFVNEFVNDYRPLIQNDNDAHLTHYMRSSSQHPERFPVKAMLKAVTKKGKLHYRPLCTAGDVVLAIMELMDNSIFDHGYVQLPHVISGPFIRETDGFYRYTYKLNTPGEWRYLKKKLSTKNALYEYLCPNFCLDAFFESKVIDNDSVDQKLRDECFAAVKVLLNIIILFIIIINNY